jgi:hypothetical protein
LKPSPLASRREVSRVHAARFIRKKPMTILNRPARWAALAAVASLSLPGVAAACACGCGVFDIGDGTFMPGDAPSGFTAWFRYAYMDQNQNWEGASKAPASDNQDKEILTNFFTLGGQYRINRQWTAMAELPIYDRDFITTDDGTVYGPNGSVYKAHINALGDLQLTAMYTGLASDMSTGLSLGVKVPTGDWKGPVGPLGGHAFDRDSLPGTGSTDLMLGVYHVGKITGDSKLSYFVQGRYQFAVATQQGYRPGNEFDSAAGVTYDLGAFGSITKVAPVLQLLNSFRDRDSEIQADTYNSGYERLLIAPGVEVKIDKVRLYADVALPIHQHTNAAPNLAIEGTSGQLVAPALFKVQVAYSF